MLILSMRSFAAICIMIATASLCWCWCWCRGFAGDLLGTAEVRGVPGGAGLERLSQLDARFLGYRDKLFQADSARFNVDTLTAQQQKDLNKVVEGFLGLLSPHFQQPAALPVLEYLIRRYRYSSNLRCWICHRVTRSRSVTEIPDPGFLALSPPLYRSHRPPPPPSQSFDPKVCVCRKRRGRAGGAAASRPCHSHLTL